MNRFAKWLRDLKVSNKELFLIALTSFFLLLVGLVSLFFILKGGNTVEYLYKNRLLSVLYLNSARAHKRAIEADLLNVIYAEKPRERQKYLADIYTRTEEWQEDLDLYKITPLTPYEIKKLKIIEDTIPKFLNEKRKLIQQAITGNREQAYAIYLDYRDDVTVFNNQLEDLVAYNENAAQERYEEYEKLVNLAKIIIPLSILLAVLLSIPLGLLISHLISVPLNSLKNKMGRVAAGELSVEPEKVISNDEIGELQGSFNQMTSNIRSLVEREQFLRSIILTSISTLQTSRVLKAVVKETGSIFDAARCYFIRYDPDKKEFIPIQDYETYVSSPEHKDLAGLQLTEALKPYIKLLIGQEQPVAIPHIDEERLPDATIKWLHEYNIKSFITAPVFFQNTPLGIIMLDFDNERQDYTQEDIDLLTTIANQSAIVVYQTGLFSEIQEARNRAEILRRIIANIRGSLDLNETFEIISKELVSIFNAERVQIIELPDKKKLNEWSIRYDYFVIPGMPGLEDVELDPEAGIYYGSKIYGKGRPLAIDNADEAPISKSLRNNINLLGLKAVLGMSVEKDEDVWGIISICTSYPRHWKQEEIYLLESISDQVYLAIKQSELYSEMENLASRLEKSLNSERTIREILLETRKMKDHDQIFNYLLERTASFFKVDRVIHLHYDENRNLTVQNEVLTRKELESIVGHPLLFAEHTEELEPVAFGEAIVINDIKQEIADPKLKEYLKNKNIEAFILYPKARKMPVKEQEKIMATTMLCSSTPRKWTPTEIDSFSLATDTTTLIYYEIIQRQAIEETRNTFLATLTHDLRSPLNASQKALEVIIKGKVGTSLDDFSEYLEDMYKTNEELLRIVNNILSVYHYEAGSYELTLQEVNIAELVDISVSSMQPLAKDQDSEIHTYIEPDLPVITADRNEILRVINNLVSNAIKHTAKGTTISVGAKRTEEGIQVSVRDNGKGIPESERPNIFQRYPTIKRKIGTGLGLYLSKQIVDAHNGRIWFHTQEGKGTIFYFTLPVS